MMPWPSSSVRAVSLVHQLPLTTNCAKALAKSAQGTAGGSLSGDGSQLRAHLVLGVDLGQLDRLLEDAVLVL